MALRRCWRWSALLGLLTLLLLPWRPAPPRAAAAPPAQLCAPRPPVSVTVAPAGLGRVQVVVSANGPGNSLQRLRFEAATNAQVEFDAQVRTPPVTLDLPAGTATTTFYVLQRVPGEAATITRLVVVDGCGEWPTMVGGGPQAYVPTPTPTATPTPTGTPTPTPTATPTGTGAWAWGLNDYGQLGDGTQGDPACSCRATPGPVSGLSGVVAIAAGGDHSLALKAGP